MSFLTVAAPILHAVANGLSGVAQATAATAPAQPANNANGNARFIADAKPNDALRVVEQRNTDNQAGGLLIQPNRGTGGFNVYYKKGMKGKEIVIHKHKRNATAADKPSLIYRGAKITENENGYHNLKLPTPEEGYYYTAQIVEAS